MLSVPSNISVDLGQKFVEQWEGGETLKQQFVAKAVEQASDEERSNNLAEASAFVSHKLEDLQRDYYAKIIAALSSATAAHDVARELSGAKSLIDSFIALGMPRSLESNDYLRSLLYGSQRVLDEDAIKELCAAAIAESLQPSARYEKVDVGVVMDQRIEALSGILKKLLDRINGGQLNESHRLLETTLQRLETYKQLKG